MFTGGERTADCVWSFQTSVTYLFLSDFSRSRASRDRCHLFVRSKTNNHPNDLFTFLATHPPVGVTRKQVCTMIFAKVAPESVITLYGVSLKLRWWTDGNNCTPTTANGRRLIGASMNRSQFTNSRAQTYET